MRISIWLVPFLAFLVTDSSVVLSEERMSTSTEAASSGKIAQKCVKDIDEFQQQLWRVGFGALEPQGAASSTPPGYSDFYVFGVQPTPRKKMRALRDAALVYALDGDEDSCEHAVASMRAVFRQHQKPLGAETEDRNVRTEWRRAHLARSRPVTEMDHLMRADIFIGSEIRNLKDERLGEIEDVVVNPHNRQVLYVLASHGGFLGFGGRLIAVRWNDLRATQDHELYVLDVLPRALDNAPAVDRDNFSKTADGEWQRSLNRYWDGVLRR